MFKNIQKYLLVNRPLLWNIRIVPALATLVLLHVIFFLIGYASGKIDFTDESEYHDNIYNYITVFFSVLVSVLFFVVWFVFYLRNNAYKSFYRIKTKYLYVEWLLIFVISAMNISYSISYFYGQNLKIKSYYSYEELQRRCEVIIMASLFTYDRYENDSVNYGTKQVVFNNKKYEPNSLINQTVRSFSVSERKSIEIKLKTWMQQDNEAAILKMMQDYFKIVQEHHLKSNIIPQKWLSLVYDYPTFTKYELPSPSSERDIYQSHSYAKYYVPQNSLESNYTEIATAWNKPFVDFGLTMFMLYFALALSLLIFSYKATNLRNWLFALVAMGCLWILTAATGTLSGKADAFYIFWFVAIAAFIAHVAVTVSRNLKKGFSGISLNLMLWSVSGLIPMIYFVLMQFYDDQKEVKISGSYDVEFTNTPQYHWLKEHVVYMSYLNVVAIAIAMYFICMLVRKWKSIPES